MRAAADVHAAAHVTGGGLPENLPRALPEDLGADLDAGSWDPGPAIAAVLATGRVADEEAWRTFNMGLGMCVVVAEGDVDAARRGRPRRAPGGPRRRAAGRPPWLSPSAWWCSSRARGRTSRA